MPGTGEVSAACLIDECFAISGKTNQVQSTKNTHFVMRKHIHSYLTPPGILKISVFVCSDSFQYCRTKECF